jgi:hypothetical protein
MATITHELVEITPGIFLWQSHDRAVKADLFSTALVTSGGTFIIDPIPLDPRQFSHLQQRGDVPGVVVSNANHQRAAAWYSEQLSAPIFAHRDVFPDKKPARFTEIRDGTKINDELEVIEIEGAVAGEVALYHAPERGTLIIGDALINFEPYGFTFLPGKYCANERRMRRSLRKLLDYQIERMLFAHGPPILSGASARLRQLLDVDL